MPRPSLGPSPFKKQKGNLAFGTTCIMQKIVFLAYFSKIMLNDILHVLQQHGSETFPSSVFPNF